MILGSSPMRTDQEYDRFPIAKRGYDPHAVEAFLELSSSDSDRILDEAAARIAGLTEDSNAACAREQSHQDFGSGRLRLVPHIRVSGRPVLSGCALSADRCWSKSPSRHHLLGELR